jgi:hypothetical protein
MAFQFRCPRGHLLQGDEAHMGMQTQCPFCDVLFIIPVVESPKEEDLAQKNYDPGAMQPDVREFLEQVVAKRAGRELPVASLASASIESRRVVLSEPSSPEFLHIPCPNGHELESPRDMLGQDVLCPHCRSQFRLHVADSREHREEREQLEHERGLFWMRGAITAAVLIGGGVLVLLLMAVWR